MKKNADALIKAIEKEDITAVKEIIAAGTDINAKNKDGETALMFAARYNENPEIAQILIDAGADVNAENRYGETGFLVRY